MDKTSILVVDDDRHYVQLVRVNLQLSGHLVLTAEDGLSAVLSVERNRPDLVILDVMLPDLDGYEVCRRIREFSRVPIIMLTARGEESHKVRELRAGADDYVTKPFGAEELLARVEAVLRRTRRAEEQRAATEFRLGELTVDYSHQRVLVREREVNLSATEYRVLCCLTANAGFVVSQDDLLAKVWGHEYRGDHDILKVCISRLRNKIESDPRHPRYILTKRGFGYVVDRRNHDVTHL